MLLVPEQLLFHVNPSASFHQLCPGCGILSFIVA